MSEQRESFRSALNRAQQFLMFDTSILAADQRERIAVALRELRDGHLTDEVTATVRMAENVVRGQSC